MFDQCGLDDPLGHFYSEMDSWKLWEIDITQPRRTGIKSLTHEWLRQYVFDIENMKNEANSKDRLYPQNC